MFSSWSAWCWSRLAECEFSHTKVINILYSEIGSTPHAEATCRAGGTARVRHLGCWPGRGRSQKVHLGPVVQQEGRLLESPPRDNHELERVVLAQDLLVA